MIPISKLHKIADRREDQGRLSDKDALDVLRLLRTTEAAAVAETWSILISDKIAGAVSLEAVGLLERLFAAPGSEGSQMAARAVTPLEAAATTAASCAALTTEILSAMKT